MPQPCLKWKNRGRSHHGLTDFILSHRVPRVFLDCDWSRRGIKTYFLYHPWSNLTLWSVSGRYFEPIILKLAARTITPQYMPSVAQYIKAFWLDPRQLCMYASIPFIFLYIYAHIPIQIVFSLPELRYTTGQIVSCASMCGGFRKEMERLLALVGLCACGSSDKEPVIQRTLELTFHLPVISDAMTPLPRYCITECDAWSNDDQTLQGFPYNL